MKKRKIPLIALVSIIAFASIVSALAIVVTFVIPETPIGKESELEAQYQPIRDTYGNGVQYYKVIDPVCFKQYRKDPEKISQCWTIAQRNFNIKDAFLNLPEIPNDFWRYKYKISKNELLDFCNLEEKYWKQPEILSDTFETSGLMFLRMNNPNQWYGSGQGIYPLGLEIGMPPNGEYTQCVLIYSSWGVETQIGYELVPYSTSDDIEVTVEPNLILLKEAYPVFNYNWIEKVTFTIKTKNAPNGIYEVGFVPATPPKEIYDKWDKENSLYQPASSVTPLKYMINVK